MKGWTTSIKMIARASITKYQIRCFGPTLLYSLYFTNLLNPSRLILQSVRKLTDPTKSVNPSLSAALSNACASEGRLGIFSEDSGD